MPTNDAAAPAQVWPGMRIQAIDIVQPPGIGISPIADMDPHQATVPAALAAKSSAETPRNTPSDDRRCTRATRSALVVLIVPPPPDARLVAPLGCAVQPLVHPPEPVQPARIAGIRMVDDPVLQRERAHAGPLAQVGGRVGSGHRRHLGDISGAVGSLPRTLAPVVVFGAPFPLLLLREPDGEVGVEVA